MGKKKVLSEKNLRQILYPSANDVLGVVQKLLGFDRVLVKCQDGYVRTCRIRGKMKRRTWIRKGDARAQNQVDDLRRKGILLIEFNT